ncbi:uncharacterized protein [Rutidosis leptorrhynchoides]|uniref:uncharacterized protein n=1 Tax=Rutidosis leptorrhynchoides TaxID=125765 RepID=UPI003A996E70
MERHIVVLISLCFVMQLSRSSAASPNKTKKHKKLDAICENEYNRHHSDRNERNSRAETRNSDNELRRSTRPRRAPVVLDISPQRGKKRRKLNDKTVSSSAKHVGKGNQSEIPCKLDTESRWKTRLRSKSRNVDVEEEKKGSEWSGKRRLFGEQSTGLNERNVDVSPKTLIVYSKRVRKVKSINNVEKAGEAEMCIKENCGREEHTIVPMEEGAVNDDTAKMGDIELEESKVSNGVEESESCEKVEAPVSKNSLEEAGDNQVERVESRKQVEKFQSCEQLEDSVRGKQVDESEGEEDLLLQETGVNQVGEVESGKQAKGFASGEKPENSAGAKQVEELEGEEGLEKQLDIEEVNANLANATQGGERDDEDGAIKMESDERPTENENAIEGTDLNLASTGQLEKSRIKQGRRCRLCGGGTDGKPPKPSLQDTGDSENELYSGSSASEQPTYDIWDGFGDETGWLGRLLGPINDRYGIAGIWVHQQCAVWSPEVYFAGLGHLKNVKAALCRGRALKCTRCGRPGATLGCRVDRCPKTYHLPCARANGCIFDHRKFLIACTDHRHFFQPHGRRNEERMKKLKAKKMKLEIRKLADDASRRDFEAEEKWLENCGEDEEFLKRESKRLHRDLLRVAPVYIGGPSSEDTKNIFEGWESVAGLQDVIRCMKEVVILPLLYPEFFDNLGLTPPRGVLLHGYPGTGKTLVVRALIGALASGDRRIAYFARKGADCLGKYVGDAERQLRLLFQVAERSQPSIIFFDEIDGLAPCRTRRQDQTHNSVVSTLLALMDGLKSRGSVVVIGATNRPDAMDPALRRPGRFDREIYFPLPSVEDRAGILSLHTQRWPKPVSGSLLKWIAQRTVGFAGADLQALCTQAALIALKRNFPLQKMLSAAEKKISGANQVPLPSFEVEDRDWLDALSSSPPPCSLREAGIAASDLASSPLPTHLIPLMLRPLSSLLVSLYLDERIWLPPPLSNAAKMVKNVIVSALEKKRLPADGWWSHLNDFLHEADIAKEVEAGLSCAGLVISEDKFPGSAAFSDVGCDNYNPQSSFAHKGGTPPGLLHHISIGSRKLGFRILIDGNARSGQRHLASCLLHCFSGNVEIQKIDLATASQEGHGDVVQGLTQILTKCASVGSCVVFMPRIDLWAVEPFAQGCETDDQSTQQCKCSDMAEPQGPGKSCSHAWSLFTEQAESICVSTSLMILATSDVPFAALPHKIKQFFRSDFSSESSPVEQRGLRFSVEVGGNFDHDAVISLSSAALSRDLIQSFVQLIHQSSHAHTVQSKEYSKPSDFLEDHRVTEHHMEDDSAANEHDERLQHPADLPMKALAPDNRNLKVKSGLHLSISLFGYQILQYPHFAELCWVSSKLKEGPHAEIDGDWKTWPFSTCIIHSTNSLDKVVIAFRNRNIKIKEKKSGVVRGLIAVGLSAYRGVYVSLREVSLEVHKVLELLVAQIDEKIQAGKDRYRYTPLLSQVAHLEDVVNSWAYGLQSLEVDAHLKATDPIPTVGPNDFHVSVDPIQSESCKENVSGANHCESGLREEKPPEDDVGVSRGDGCPVSDKGVAEERLSQNHPDNPADVVQSDVVVSEEALLLDNDPIKVGDSEAILLDKDPPVKGNDSEASKLHDKYINGQENAETGFDEPGTSGFPNGYPKMMEHSNIQAEKGLHNLAELDGINFPSSSTVGNKVNGAGITPNDVGTVDLPSGRSSGHYAEPGALCVYRCCSECQNKLHNMVQKILINRWGGIDGGNWMVDDVHDIVSSLSVDLLSAVTKVYIHTDMKLSDNSESSSLLPVKCDCHALSQCEMGNTNGSGNIQSGLSREFVFSDGVLVSSDSYKDAPFHCKFETLCLCPLMDSILMKKKPFD